MSTSPHRYPSLPAQVATRIIVEIEKGTWTGWLPGERDLAKTLQVGRKTLRKGLCQLQRDGVIDTQHGLGHRIIAAPPPNGAATKAETSVGLLTPETL